MGETSWVYLYQSQKKEEFDSLVLTGVLNTTMNWAKCVFSNVPLQGEVIPDG